MKTTLLMFMLTFAVGSFALTGFGESPVFEISEDTLPVELSSFTAIATQNNFVQLDWVTQSESGVSGYYIYRNVISSLANAEVVSTMIPAGNTSQEQSYSYTDNEVTSGIWYYWLQCVEMDGQDAFHGSISVTITNPGEEPSIPLIPSLTAIQSIFPNPFNPVTTVSFYLAKSEQVNLSIYNIRGEKVRTIESDNLFSGTYRRTWNGTDDGGLALTSGVYFLKMTAGNYTSTAKIVLLK